MSDSKPSLSDLRIDDHARYGGSGRMGLALLVLAVAAVAGAALWFWLRAPRAVPVRVAAVVEIGAESGRGAPAVLNASGYVTARRRATVSSKMTGKVVEVLVEEGMAVRAGQVLARLDDTTLRRYLELAGAELAASRLAAARDRGQAEGGAPDAGSRPGARARRHLRAGGPGPRRGGGGRAQGPSRPDPRAGDGGRAAGGAAPGRSRRHGDSRPVLRRGALERRAARRDGVAGLGRRRVHAHRHLDDRRHVVARDRSGRERELHQPGHARAARRGDARRVSGLAHSRPRHHDRAHGGPPEGDGAGPHRVRAARSADPAGHGREGGLHGRARSGGRVTGPASSHARPGPRSGRTRASPSCSSSSRIGWSAAPSGSARRAGTRSRS